MAWKKLIYSGSDARLNTLTVTGITSGSLFSGSFVGNGSGLTGITGGTTDLSVDDVPLPDGPITILNSNGTGIVLPTASYPSNPGIMTGTMVDKLEGLDATRQLPAGGAAYQILAKLNSTDYNASWISGSTLNLIILTTTGTSGAATYDSGSGVLNIPQYGGSTNSVTDLVPSFLFGGM